MVGPIEPENVTSIGRVASLFDYWRPSGDWVRTNLFRLVDSGIGCRVVREGDEKRGAVVIHLVVSHGRGRVLSHVRRPDGKSTWIPVHDQDTLGQDAAERALLAAVARDRDLWLMRIEAAGLQIGRDDDSP